MIIENTHTESKEMCTPKKLYELSIDAFIVQALCWYKKGSLQMKSDTAASGQHKNPCSRRFLGTVQK